MPDQAQRLLACQRFLLTLPGDDRELFEAMADGEGSKPEAFLCNLVGDAIERYLVRGWAREALRERTPVRGS